MREEEEGVCVFYPFFIGPRELFCPLSVPTELSFTPSSRKVEWLVCQLHGFPLNPWAVEGSSSWLQFQPVSALRRARGLNSALHPSGWKHSWSSVTASKQLRLNQCLRWLRGAWGQSWAISPLRSEALWTLKVISEMTTPRAEISQDQQHGLFLWLVGKGGASISSCKIGWSGVLALSFRERLTLRTKAQLDKLRVPRACWRTHHSSGSVSFDHFCLLFIEIP